MEPPAFATTPCHESRQTTNTDRFWKDPLVVCYLQKADNPPCKTDFPSFHILLIAKVKEQLQMKKKLVDSYKQSKTESVSS